MIRPGDRVGKYEVRRLLGQGGFGMVFAAHDTKLDRDCAMKFLLPEHTARPEILQRFLKEARSAAKIKHGGIVTVFEADVVEGMGARLDGMAFIVMELLEGESLSDRLTQGPMAIERALDVTRQCASALAAAHAVGIIHRDLKPDNIFLVPDPATVMGERVKVLDFGIAKLADDGASGAGGGGMKTNTHMIFGTPKYMSPEQCKSSAKVDERSDIYALGCILFEMVTGRTPFEGDVGELIAMQQLMAPPSAKSMRADLPPAVDAAIAAMLAKPPAQRPATMTEVVKQMAPSTAAMPAATSAASGPMPVVSNPFGVAINAASSPEPGSTVPATLAPTELPDVPPPAPTPARIDAAPAAAAPPPARPESSSPPAPASVPPARPETPARPDTRAANAPPVAVAAPTKLREVPPSMEAPGTRSMVPLYAIAGVVLVGAAVAIVVLGRGTSRGHDAPKNPGDAGVPVTDAAPRELTGKALVDRLAEFRTRAAKLVAAKQCDQLPALATEGAAASPLIGRELAHLPCAPGSFVRPGEPDPGKTYAVPITGAPVDGTADAVITLVTFSDYACSYCEKANPTLAELQRLYGSKLRIVHKQLVIHPNAAASAHAACAAAKQGKFDEMDRVLWAKAFKAQKYDAAPACWDTPNGCPIVDGFAAEIGLDLDRYSADMADPCTQQLATDAADAARLGVSATPVFFVNGRYVSGAAPVAVFQKLVDEELAKANSRLGTTPAWDYYQRWVLDKGLTKVEPLAPLALDDPDPLESSDILARPASGTIAPIQYLLVGWDFSSSDPISQKRTKADADAIAAGAAAAMRAGEDSPALADAISDGGFRHAVVLTAADDGDWLARLHHLAFRLHDDEVGMVRTPLGWIVAKRVAPIPPPADVAAPPEAALVTPKGARYRALSLGTGTLKPGPNNVARVRLTVWKSDGTLVESTTLTGGPTEMRVGAMPAGLADTVQQMREGDTVRIWMPESLGLKGKGAIVVDCELVSFK